METTRIAGYDEKKDGIMGLISDVQRFCIHDGPGIRTTVFMKGCPLRCFWCHNPETWHMKQEVQLFTERCIGCGECFKCCPAGAHFMIDGQRRFKRELCTACGKCVESCYSGALVMAGKWWTPNELMKVLLKDKNYYENSGGGITLSGGEPLLQQQFSLQVLKLCREAGLSTAIETCGMYRWGEVEELLPWLDLVIMDIKVMDEEKHWSATGASNKNILANAQKYSETGIPLIIRTPVIPTVNDTVEDIGAIVSFIRYFPNLMYYELMPFHQMAGNKYKSLDLPNKAKELQAPAKGILQTLAQYARDIGLPDVRIG